MIIFNTFICRDGYQIVEDNGDVCIRAATDNFDEATPIPQHQILFRRFAAIGRPVTESNHNFNEETSTLRSKLNIDGIIGFAESYGLLTNAKRTEAESLHHWDTALESMNAAINCWTEYDFTTLVSYFDKGAVARSSKKLAIVPDQAHPQIIDEAPTLIDAMWTQFALAVSKNETQLQCDNCKEWFTPKRKRTTEAVFCTPRCQKANQHKRKKGD
jgi:hypothetical protein